jgi:hypothetical protein
MIVWIAAGWIVLAVVRAIVLELRGRVCHCDDASCIRGGRYVCPRANDAFDYCLRIWDWRRF